jgi:hypothetical protein
MFILYFSNPQLKHDGGLHIRKQPSSRIPSDARFIFECTEMKSSGAGTGHFGIIHPACCGLAKPG